MVRMPRGVVPAELAAEGGGWKEAPLMLEAELSVVLVDGVMEMLLMAEGSVSLGCFLIS